VNPPRLLRIEWEDIVTRHNKARTLDAYQRGRCRRRSVGELLHADEEILILTEDIPLTEGDEDDTGTWTIFPRGCVIRVTDARTGRTLSWERLLRWTPH